MRWLLCAGCWRIFRPVCGRVKNRALHSAAMLRTLLFGIVALSTCVGLTRGADVDFTRDVIYGKGGGEDLKLDIARPAGDAKRLPCIVFIHGGAWRAGSRAAH